MKQLAIFILSLFYFSLSFAQAQKPNIIYILADDLGYAETGAYGSEKIETPNIDLLALEGVKFNQHYSGSAVCAPSRSVLLTGLHTGHTPIRGNHEWGERGEVWNIIKASEDPNLEGQYPMPDTTKTIAHYLKEAGYTTGMVGKWGLGGPLSNSIPTKMGFDYFCGYNCQRQAHNYYPAHLWENEEKLILRNELIPPGTGLNKTDDPNQADSYKRYKQTDYAPDIMHERALNFIVNNKDKPFYLYYASPLPHLPLQANEELTSHYIHKFGEEEPYTGKAYFPNQYPRAAYAAMVSTLDQQIGEIILKLRELGIEDQTIIMFSSDNGPSYLGGTDSPWFDSAFPFKSEYGWGKGFLKEGGIRVPFIVKWKDFTQPGTTTDVISSFEDILPTLAEVTGAQIPDYLDGQSLLKTIKGDTTKIHDYLYWEFPEYGGQQAVRIGKWKGLRNNLVNKNKEVVFELYNLESDIQELHDISAEYPEITALIESIMKKEHRKSSIERFLLPKIDN